MIKRRDFLAFIGRSTALAAAVGPLELLAGCAHKPSHGALPFSPLAPSLKDEFAVANGFTYELLIKWGEQINTKGQKFGFNNDFIAYKPLSTSNPNEGILWVNHEYNNPLMMYGLEGKDPWSLKTKENVKLERESVGGSLLHIKYQNKKWVVQKNSSYNRRIDAYTPIKFSKNTKVFNSTHAIGTFGNCSGGMTPWGTFLSGEENYHHFVGEVAFSENGERVKTKSKDPLSWDNVVDLPPEHYGWVVEIEPTTGKATKHISLGRFAHEGAKCVAAKDGRCVVYLGDDANDEHFYKFISDKPGTLDSGILYVANIEKKQWIPLDVNLNSNLKAKFKDQTQLLIRTREAAKMVDATPLDRPEGCDIDPITGAVFLNCTNNKKRGRPHGSIHKFVEQNNDYLSLNFSHSVFVTGGEDSGISCPDNIAFDKKGNLWIATDISDEALGKGEYEFHGNNALFYIPMSGEFAGQIMRVANAPVEAELTGPCFSPDGKTLFLSIQHPGGAARSLKEISSHWPEGGSSIPKPSVVAINLPEILL